MAIISRTLMTKRQEPNVDPTLCPDCSFLTYDADELKKHLATHEDDTVDDDADFGITKSKSKPPANSKPRNYITANKLLDVGALPPLVSKHYRFFT